MKTNYQVLSAILLRRYGSDIISSPLFLQEKLFLQHGNVSVFSHSISVALMAIWIARKLRIKVDERVMTRGALLHDYFLYDWHEKADWHRFHGFHHPDVACENAKRDFGISHSEAGIIKSHMFPLTIRRLPQSKEALIVCIADKICAFKETLQRG